MKRNEDKPILVIFEGVDKSGKTTLKDEFNKRTNFKYVVLDRLTTSSKIYNEFFERDRLEYYENFEDVVRESFNVLVVLCECDTSLIVERLAKANEKLPRQLENIDEVKKRFEEVLERSYENYTVIDTSKTSIKECVESIIAIVNRMEVHHG